VDAVDDQARTPLHRAAGGVHIGGERLAVIGVLLSAQAGLHKACRSGLTALHWAATNGKAWQWQHCLLLGPGLEQSPPQAVLRCTLLHGRSRQGGRAAAGSGR
jgi:hypothetical protein